MRTACCYELFVSVESLALLWLGWFICFACILHAETANVLCMNLMHSPRRQPPSSPRSAPARVIDTTALRRQFDEFDKNGSGFIERNECIAALAKLGSKLKDLDMDGDSRISFEEVRHFAWHTSRFAMHRQPPFPCISHAAHDAANLPCACLRCRV